MFSRATFLLTQEEILPEEINEAEDLLQNYVILFEQYYGLDNMRITVHLLLHFTDTVRAWGPCWVYSTYNFESANYTLMKSVNSARSAADQIVLRFLLKSYVRVAAMHEELVSDRTRNHIFEILEKKHRVARKVGNAYLLGSSKERQPTAEETIVLQREGQECQRLCCYERMLYRNSEYRVPEYGVEDARTDNTSLYTWGDTICTIVSVVVLEKEDEDPTCGLFVNEHTVVCPFTYAKHVCRKTNEDEDLFHFVPVPKIRSPAAKVRVGESWYMTQIPNRHEIDL